MEPARQRESEQHPATDDGPRLFTATATVAACIGFVLLGALQTYYGPSIPALRSRFGLAPSGAGLALSMYFGGAVAGVLVSGIAHRRTRNSRLLITSFLVMGIGALGFALCANWLCALAASLVSGFGTGGMDYGLNQLFSVGFGRRSPAMLGILNAHFGIGAITGPFVIGLIGAHNYPYAFAATAALLLVTSWFFRTVRDAEPKPASAALAADSPHTAHHHPPPARPSTPVLSVLIAFLALYALQVAVETGIGAWEPTYLQLLGHGAHFAANATSGFWLMLTLGRFLLAPLTLRWSEPTIVWISCLGTTVCLPFAAIPGLAPYALAGAGLFNAPVFPAALPWLGRAIPDVRWAATGAVLTANLGGMAAGPLLGLAIEVFGSGSMPWALTLVSGVCLLLAVKLKTTTHRING